jgi:hypothetical protein
VAVPARTPDLTVHPSCVCVASTANRAVREREAQESALLAAHAEAEAAGDVSLMGEVEDRLAQLHGGWVGGEGGGRVK